MARVRTAQLAQQKLKKESARFENPPITPTDTIQALRTPDELRAEGKQQHNCVGTYCSKIHDGNNYIYRVLAPERATLSIVKGPGGWRIEELKTACNMVAKEATYRAVKDWLSTGHRLGFESEYSYVWSKSKRHLK